MKRHFETLRLILGDQLDIRHPWFAAVDDDVLYVIAELHQEQRYARHHVQKVCCFFLAMEKFAAELHAREHRVLHLTLDDTASYESLPELLDALMERFGARRLEYQLPDEYRLSHQLADYAKRCTADVTAVDSDHFLLPRSEIERYFSRGKHLLMETFYRDMRRRHGILMTGGKPVGGRWNFDTENRKKLPANVEVPAPRTWRHDIRAILDRIDRHDIETIGVPPTDGLDWPVSRRESLALVNHFCSELLPRFGKYQDALTDRGWALFHSRLSFSLNVKLIRPLEVVERALAAWRARREKIPLAAVEGFVRQIIGWREFMRGIYWTFMPDYARRNHFRADGTLPSFYWDGETRMHCMRTAIRHSLDHAYSHHIQRLMVTGNFALLAGVHPDEVDAWYLGIYADAIEWVEITNTRGMSQYADGGVVATKPYIASGKYIQRMSDHCGKCAYNVATRSGEGACPFTVFFWDFLDRHRDTLSGNHRMGMMLRNLERIPATEIEGIRTTARRYRRDIDSL